MNKLELLGRVIQAPDVSYLGVLFPNFHITNKIDRFSPIPIIYTSVVGIKTRSVLSARPAHWVGFSVSGGELALSRELLFELCSSRKRTYKKEYDSLSDMDFVHQMGILSVVDKLQYEDEESRLYPIFVSIASFSKESIKLVFEYTAQRPPALLLSSLITFYGRVVNMDENSTASSAHYTMILKKAAKKKSAFHKALLDIGSMEGVSPELMIQHMILSVVV